MQLADVCWCQLLLLSLQGMRLTQPVVGRAATTGDAASNASTDASSQDGQPTAASSTGQTATGAMAAAGAESSEPGAGQSQEALLAVPRAHVTLPGQASSGPSIPYSRSSSGEEEEQGSSSGRGRGRPRRGRGPRKAASAVAAAAAGSNGMTTGRGNGIIAQETYGVGVHGPAPDALMSETLGAVMLQQGPIPVAAAALQGISSSTAAASVQAADSKLQELRRPLPPAPSQEQVQGHEEHQGDHGSILEAGPFVRPRVRRPRVQGEGKLHRQFHDDSPPVLWEPSYDRALLLDEDLAAAPVTAAVPANVAATAAAVSNPPATAAAAAVKGVSFGRRVTPSPPLVHVAPASDAASA
jgi:hypothetical protein